MTGSYVVGDVIGCGLDQFTNSITFYKNGKRIYGKNSNGYAHLLYEWVSVNERERECVCVCVNVSGVTHVWGCDVLWMSERSLAGIGKN